jgi:hypothetical protein
MIGKTALCMIVAASLFGGIRAASAQAPQTANNRDTCVFSSWCWTYVTVAPNAAGTPVASLSGPEFRMQNKLSGATLAWMLMGSPDYEFRANSVIITGANAAGSAAQFPLRVSSATLFPMDDLNTNNVTYTYEVRVYKKGSPPGSTPVTVSGSIVNSSK